MVCHACRSVCQQFHANQFHTIKKKRKNSPLLTSFILSLIVMPILVSFSNYDCGYSRCYIGVMVNLTIQGFCMERTVKRIKDLAFLRHGHWAQGDCIRTWGVNFERPCWWLEMSSLTGMHIKQPRHNLVIELISKLEHGLLVWMLENSLVL